MSDTAKNETLFTTCSGHLPFHKNCREGGIVHGVHAVPADEPKNLSPVNLREKDWIYRYIDAWMEENLEKAIDDYFDKKRANSAWSEEQQAVERYWRLTLDGPRSPRALDVALVPDGWLGITGGQFNRMYDVERQHLVWVRV
jgi:hypothetical protein